MLEVPAPSAGVLAQVIKHDGDIVIAEQIIAKIDTEATAGQAPAAVAAAGDAEVKPAPVAAAAAPAAQVAQATASSSTASPAAGKMLAEKGLGAEPGRGHGPRRPRHQGRRARRDARRAGSAGGSGGTVRTRSQAAPAPAAKAAKPSLPDVRAPGSAEQWLKDRPEQRVPMSRLRARIAERLLESQQTNAILTTFNEVNMAPVMDLRNKYKDKFEKEHGVKLGFMSFFVKAAVHALKKFPLVNASIDGNDIVYHGYFDIGIAVGSPRGLVVPILRNADQMSLADIEKKIAEFGQKAKDGKLSIEEMTGGTFSISNGGVFGSMLSTPIINPPQSAILGVHATKERAVVENGQIVIRPMNYLALSYDHRIIDGREAVLSLVAMKDALEDPARLLLDL